MEIQNLSLVDNVRTAVIYFTLQLEGVRDQGGLKGLKKKNCMEILCGMQWVSEKK
jgi:hypothetical protein